MHKTLHYFDGIVNFHASINLIGIKFIVQSDSHYLLFINRERIVIRTVLYINHQYQD